jgi:hypothetical protein
MAGAKVLLLLDPSLCSDRPEQDGGEQGEGCEKRKNVKTNDRAHVSTSFVEGLSV